MVLQTLAIDPSMQRHGLTSDIIEFCIDKAKSEGYDAIRIDVILDNYPAKKIFLKRMDLSMWEMLIWNWI